MHGVSASPRAQSPDELRDAIRTGLDALARARPDLIPALDLQGTLLSREVDLLFAISAGGLPSLKLPAGYVAAKLSRGVPVLYGEPIPLPLPLLETSAREFCDRLAAGGAGDAASSVGRAIDARNVDAGTAIAACLARDQRRVRLIATRCGISPDILWLIAELALAPFVHLLQSRVLLPVDADSRLGAARDGWDHGFCPACASWPAIVEATGGRNLLRCSFCAAAWTLTTCRCIYCANHDERFITAASDAQHASSRLQTCGKCGGYVKVIEVNAPTPFPLVAIEDLATMDLDVAAMNRKYMRPPLPEIQKLSG
jgi:FdhE protein